MVGVPVPVSNGEPALATPKSPVQLAPSPRLTLHGCPPTALQLSMRAAEPALRAEGALARGGASPVRAASLEVVAAAGSPGAPRRRVIQVDVDATAAAWLGVALSLAEYHTEEQSALSARSGQSMPAQLDAGAAEDSPSPDVSVTPEPTEDDMDGCAEDSNVEGAADSAACRNEAGTFRCNAHNLEGPKN